MFPRQVQDALNALFNSCKFSRVEFAGWTSVVVLILIFGGVQLLSLGIVSEYVGRTYEEVKRRPRYVIESLTGIE